MHNPMEILSNVTPRTGSGSGVRQQTRPGNDGSSARFERILEGEISRLGSRLLNKMSSPDGAGNFERPVEAPKQDDMGSTTGEELAAGVTGNQQSEVVFILEGDRESVAIPEVRVEDTVEPPVNNQKLEPEEPPTDNKQFTLVAEEHVKTNGTVGEEANTTKPAATAATTVSNEAYAAGEATARMPEIRTQDSQNNAETNSNSFGNGNLSPLENENDDKQVEQKEMYSQAADAVRSAVREKTDEVREKTDEGTQPKTEAELNLNEIAPPLSEGIKPEQFKATQQMQAALNTPVKTENLFQEMINRVEMMQTDTKSAMTITLNPEHLGNVALEVAIDAAGLHVRINAEDSGVRSMINGQLTSLIESLSNKGIEVAEVEVVYTGINNGAFKEPHDGQQQSSQGQRRSRHYETSTADAISYYTVLPDMMDYYLDAGVSSVEYSA